MAAPNSGKKISSSHGGVQPSPRFPWLMAPEDPAGLRRFYDIPNHMFRVYSVPGAPTHRCVASGHGWLVLATVGTPRRIALVNPVTRGRVVVEWPFGNNYIDRLHAVLTCSPRDPECLLAVASDRIIAYCRPCPSRPWAGWRTLRAAGFRYDAAASDMVCVGAVVYLVDERRDLRRVDLADPEPKVERRCTRFPLPGDATLRHYYLAESLGVVHLALTDEHCRRVFLFTMDWGGSRWVQAKDWASGRLHLLLGRGCSAIVPSSAARRRRPRPNTLLLAARQPSTAVDAGAVGGGGGGGGDGDGERVWFWTEFAKGEGTGCLVATRKPPRPPRGEFNAGDSFWFFPSNY